MIKPIKKQAQTFKPAKPQPWKMLGVAFSLQKLDRVLGLRERELEYILAEGQRRGTR